MKRIQLGMLLIIISTIIIGVSFSLPWYEQRYTDDSSYLLDHNDPSDNSSSDEREGSKSVFDSSSDVTIYQKFYLHKIENGLTDDEDSLESRQLDGNTEDNIKNTFDTTKIILIFTLIFNLILFSLYFIYKPESKFKKFVIIVGTITILFPIIAPINFMFSVPSSFKQDINDIYEDAGLNYVDREDYPYAESFYGSRDFDSGKMEWGPGVGWYLIFLVSIINLSGLVLFIKSSKQTN